MDCLSIVTDTVMGRGNFAQTRTSMMNERIDIPAGLYEDEVVCFLADRYHTSAKNVVKCFLVQDGINPVPENEPATFRLEENEMEIMRGLIYGSPESYSLKTRIE